MQRKRKKLLRLKYYRSKYNITQMEMAEAIETCHSNYANIENGRTKCYPDKMIKIRNYINQKAREAGDTELTLDDIFDDLA